MAERDSRYSTVSEPTSSMQHTVIEKDHSLSFVNLRELWDYRDLVRLLAARDLRSRYRQSVLGVAWSLVQPLITLGVFAVFFGLMGREPTNSGAPYVVSLLCGIVIWNFFAGILAATANSLPDNLHLITKVYCPRLVFPLATIIVCLADLIVAFVVLSLLCAYYGIFPALRTLWAPVFIGLAALTALASGLCISALSVRWRDIRFMVPALLQAGFFASPVVYEAGSLIPERLKTPYFFNPMAGIIEGFRWCLIGGSGFEWSMLAISAPLALVVLIIALFLFRRVERCLPDFL